MKDKTPGLWKIKAGLTLVGTIAMRELNKGSKNGLKAQAATLRGLLEPARDTVYGKKHNFAEILAAKTPEELFKRYDQYVKINDYDDLKPYIERHKSGEADVLFPG
jgi:hypothetical protein